MSNAGRCGVQTVKHKGHGVGDQVLLAEAVLPLQLQEVVDEVVPILGSRAPEAEGFANNAAHEAVVGAGKDLGAEATGQVGEEAGNCSGDGQTYVFAGHLLVLSDHRKRILAEAARLDSQDTVEQGFARESKSKLDGDSREKFKTTST